MTIGGHLSIFLKVCFFACGDTIFLLLNLHGKRDKAAFREKFH